MTTEIVYDGHDNTIDLLLKADGTAQDLSEVTRMTLEVGSTTVDSDESGSAFDWAPGMTGKLILALGDEDLTAGTYRAILTVYDPSNTDGIVWGTFKLIVRG